MVVEPRPLRILVVDDEPDVRLFHRHVLSQVAEVDEAGSVYEALAAAESTPYDVVIADLLMPGARATDLARRMRDRGITTPIVVVTAASEEALRGEGTDHLFEAVLAKPISAGLLLRTVCGLCTVMPVSPADEVEVNTSPVVLALRRQSAIAANLAEGVALVRASDAALVYTNRAWDLLFGYDRGELAGRDLRVVTAHTGSDVERAAREGLERQGVWRGEFEGLHKDGSRFWCEADVSTFEDAEYGPVWICVVRDITARKAAVEAILAGERRLRHVFDRSPVGLALVDRDLHLVSVNPALCSLLGYDQESLVGRPLGSLTPEEDATRDAAFVADLFSAGHGGFDIEKRYLTSGGRAVWVRVSGAYIPNTGWVAADEVLLVIEDISATKSTEERLTFLATHDPLTGMTNRNAILPAIETAQARAERSDSWLAVAFLDLDHFKHINDERGHAVGDEVLKHVARKLYQSLRPGDTFARVGGDEFAACCENLGGDAKRAGDTAAQVGARLTEAVGEVAAELGADLGCSVGIVLCRDRRQTADELLSAADAAMYRVKRRGGGGIEVVFESEEASVGGP